MEQTISPSISQAFLSPRWISSHKIPCSPSEHEVEMHYELRPRHQITNITSSTLSDLSVPLDVCEVF
jgi:hypothetical protein